MGAHQNNVQKDSKKSKRRGRVNTSRRLDSFVRSAPSSGGDWGSCTAERMQAVVVGITALGGAVTFGLSRDGGAHSLTLLLDDSRQTLWFNGDADLDDELVTVIDVLAAIE